MREMSILSPGERRIDVLSQKVLSCVNLAGVAGVDIEIEAVEVKGKVSHELPGERASLRVKKPAGSYLGSKDRLQGRRERDVAGSVARAHPPAKYCCAGRRID